MKKGDLIETKVGNLAIFLGWYEHDRDWCVIQFPSGNINDCFHISRIKRILNKKS